METNVKLSHMRPKTFKILERAVEDGVSRGYRRAHKHIDSPNESELLDHIGQAVMSEICEWFAFDDEE